MNPEPGERAISVRKVLLFLLILTMGGADSVMSEGKADESLNAKGYATEAAGHISIYDSVKDIVKHPAFKGFGEYLLPWDDNTNYYNTLLTDVGSLLPYHSHVNPGTVVGALNHMIDEVNDGRTIFFNFYSAQQKQQDPGKASAGLFFFKGDPGAPFAVVCPGGGFAYVGSLHEGFPHALELSNKGYNAFVLKYRAGSGTKASEDLAAALSYIFQNAAMFEVGTKDYSLWGSSAGARMVGDVALHGSARWGGRDIPKPGAVIIAYTGHSSFSGTYPPRFLTVSEDVRIVRVPIVD